MQTNVQQMRERLDAAMVGLRTALDPERRKAALADVLAPFKRGGPYAYVPAKEGRIPAEQRWLKRENQHASFKLFAFERAVMDIEPAIRDLKADAMRPMSNEDALLRRTKQSGCSLEVHLQVQQLDELRRLRLVPELRNASPAVVAARYAEAQKDPTDQASCTLIAVVEELHGEGWTGRELTQAELPAVQQLRRAIASARQQRIPDDVRAMEAAIEAAKIEAGRAKTLHRVTPLNPDHVRPLADDEE